MSGSLATQVLAMGILAFVGIASAMLMWSGLAAEFARGRGGAHAAPGSRARLVVGVVGFTLALWIALGVLTHAW